MSVHVDEARRDELPSCVDGRGCFDAREVADGIDATLTYADIGGKPEADENVARFLGALGEMAAREGNRLFWVLGIDMAHMGHS